MYELPKRVQSHIFPGEAYGSHCLDLWAGSLYVDSSTMIQMVSRGFKSREFPGRSSFGIKLANPSDTMLA